MSFESEILSAVVDLIKRNREVLTYAGVVQSIDATSGIVSVIVDGASAPTPCRPTAHVIWATGQRVVVLKAAKDFYVVGVIATQRTLKLPKYTGTHPIGTETGDMWYRTDLNHAYVNVNGTPTQMDN